MAVVVVFVAVVVRLLFRLVAIAVDAADVNCDEAVVSTERRRVVVKLLRTRICKVISLRQEREREKERKRERERERERNPKYQRQRKDR